jgi:hypothetical protein
MINYWFFVGVEIDIFVHGRGNLGVMQRALLRG